MRSRHLAYGVFLLRRPVAEHGEPVWHAIAEQLADLREPAIGVIDAFFSRWDPVPFGLEREDFLDFTARQLDSRLDRIEAARGESLESVLGSTIVPETT